MKRIMYVLGGGVFISVIAGADVLPYRTGESEKGPKTATERLGVLAPGRYSTTPYSGVVVAPPQMDSLIAVQPPKDFAWMRVIEPQLKFEQR